MHSVQFYRAEALIAQRGKCHYCKCPLTSEAATADHKHPVSRWGRSTQDNIAAACEPCNRAKGSLSEGAFFNLIAKKRPVGLSIEIMFIWACRRIWKRTHRACDRITSVVREAGAQGSDANG